MLIKKYNNSLVQRNFYTICYWILATAFGFIFLSNPALSAKSPGSQIIQASEIVLLPKMCRTLKEHYYSPDSETQKHRLPRNHALERKIPGLNHFCLGLMYELRADRNFRDKELKKSQLVNAVNSIIYTSKRLQDSPEELNRLTAFVFTQQARIRLKRNNTQLGIADYRYAIQRDPTFTKAYYGLSDYFEKIGAIDQALRTVKEGLKHKPKSKGLKRRLDRLNSKIKNDSKK